MKKYIKIIALSLLLGCIWQLKAQDYRGKVLVRSHTMFEQEDLLNVTFDVLVCGNSVQSGAALRITPKIITHEQAKAFPNILIMGHNKSKTYNRWLKTMSRQNNEKYIEPGTVIRVNNQTDTLLTYKYIIPYELWMDDAVFVLDQEIISYNDNRSLVSVALDGRVKLSPRVPYQVQPVVSYLIPVAEQKVRKLQGQAFLDFQVAKYVILPNFRRNPQELAKIEAAFSEFKNNADAKINGMFIEGYASPDGRYEMNDRLSRERAEALKSYILNSFNIPLSGNQIRTSHIAEDWDGLKVLLQSSNIARADDVISIIDSESNIVRRKQKIQALGGGAVYRKMLNELYPQLRRVEYQIDFAVKDYKTEEAKNFVNRNPEMLSQLELYNVAWTYPTESAEFEEIMLDIIPRQFKDDPAANINAAALMIQHGELVAARRILEKYAANPTSWNNLGILELYAGELDKAEELFRRAAAAGVEQATVNSAEVEKKRQDEITMKRFQ